MSGNAVVTRTLMGKVTSDKRHMTRTVVVEWNYRHEQYGKVMKKRTSYQVHDENNECKTGDVISFKEVRPISKTKCWQLVQIVERAEAV